MLFRNSIALVNLSNYDVARDSATSIHGAILVHIRPFPYKWTSISGEVGNGDLNIPRVITPTQMTSIDGREMDRS